MPKLALIALFLLGLSVQAFATDARRLEQIQKQHQQAMTQSEKLSQRAEAQAKELSVLRSQLITSTAKLEEANERLEQTEKNLADLNGSAQRRLAELNTRRSELAQTLAVLQRLSLMPPAAQLLRPTSPLERLRADMQIKALLPVIQERTRLLNDAVADIKSVRARLEKERQQLTQTRAQQAEQKASLAQLVTARNKAQEKTRQQSAVEQAKAERLAAQAKSLRALIEQMERQSRRQTSANTTPLIAAPLTATAARLVPVKAPVLLRFGQKDSFGSLSKGMTLQTKPGIPVVAVANGKVAFSGPFRGYGRILILSHAGDFHTVMAGLGQTDVAVGESVAAGEPVGTMPETDAQLYYEVRHAGSPIDPLSKQAATLIAQ